jgi:hypothetical protein
MARLGEYGVRLACGEESIYLERFHQERVMHAISRRGFMAFSASRTTLEYLAGLIAMDVTGDSERITREYLRERMRKAMTGDEDSNSPYFYIPPLGVKDHPEMTNTGLERLKLPEVVCAGIFSSGPGGPSCVLAVWYQDEFALPIDERVIIQLSRMDWDRYCYEDYSGGGGDDL